MKKISLIILTALAITACKKTQPTPVTNTQIDVTQLLLKSEVEIAPGGKDTSIAYFYQYDGKNRMSQSIRVSYTNGSRYADTTVYTYAATGVLDHFRYFQGGRFSLTNTFYYTNNTPSYFTYHAVSDIGTAVEQTTNYTFNVKLLDSKVVAVTNQQQLNFPMLTSDSITYTGNNIRSVQWGFLNYKYGTKKGQLHDSGFALYFGQFTPLAGQNEVLEVDTILTPTTAVGKFAYTYNSAGFPVTAVKTNAQGQLIGNVTYTYTNLK